jgi:hypothetical protein
VMKVSTNASAELNPSDQNVKILRFAGDGAVHQFNHARWAACPTKPKARTHTTPAAGLPRTNLANACNTKSAPIRNRLRSAKRRS